MNKALRYTLLTLPVLAIAGIAWWQIRKYKVPGKQQLPPAKPPVVPMGTAALASSFPLKKGSKNVYVEQLQQALINNFGPGVLSRFGADGDWGSETETAMLRYTSKNQIDSANDLQATIVQMQNLKSANIAVYKKMADDLMLSFNLFVAYIVCQDDKPWQQVVSDGNNGWFDSGYIIPVHSGLKMSTVDYKLTGVDNATGFIIVRCGKGGNMGDWKVCPESIKLQ